MTNLETVNYILVLRCTPAIPEDRLGPEQPPTVHFAAEYHSMDQYEATPKPTLEGDYVVFEMAGKPDEHGIRPRMEEVDRFSIRPPQQEPVTVTGFRSSE